MSAQNFKKASTQRSEWQEFKEEHTCNEGVSYIKRLQIRKQGTDAKMRQCLEAGLLVSFHIKKTKRKTNMAKSKKSIFFCQNCGHEENKWLGQCPVCREWNTFVEEKITASGNPKSVLASVKEVEILSLNDVETEHEERIYTKIGELDRVLGGGIVPGSLILVGGDPGIGKSTLLLQVCRELGGDTEEDSLYFRGKSHSGR